MQSYLYCSKRKKSNLKIDFILKKYFKKYEIKDTDIKIILSDDEDIINLSLEIEKNNKTTFIFAECQKNNSNILERIEELNCMIDDYDRTEDVLMDIIKIWRNRIINKKIIVSKKNKDKLEFSNKLDVIKQNYILNENAYNIKSKLFSFRSMIEMLGDQLIKIYQDEKFNIDLDCFNSLEDFTVILENFEFNNSSDLKIILRLSVSIDWITNPPNLLITSNKILKDNILQVIEKLKPFNDVKSWSIKYSIYDTVNNIYNMINKFGEIHVDNPDKFETLINDLEYLFSIKSINISPMKLLELFDKELVQDNSVNNYNKNNNNNNKYNNSYNPQYWKKGTGYGHDGNSSNWDIEQYVANLNNKKKTIGIKMREFLEHINNENVKKHLEKITELLQTYMNDDEVTNDIVCEIGSVIIKNIINNSNILNKDNNKLIKLISQVKEYLEENNIKHELNEENKTTEVITKIVKEKIEEKLDDFQKMFNNQRFRFIDNSYNKFYYDDNKIGGINLVTSKTINNTQISRLQKEFVILKKSICITKYASIFFSIEKTNIQKMRFIITGPIDTPYSYGLYIFDMTIPSDFPNKPPVVHFSNNGNKRFNPNLYDCGKVCLSLLGTWSTSDKGEMWNSSTSTFNQLLFSIQSQILIEEPYFNEPGHEKSIGKPHGIESSKKYNWNIRKYNLDHAVNDLIEGVINNKSQYKEFEYVIRNYFKFHKNNIIEQNLKWYNENPDNKNAFKTSMDKFESIVDML